jgi:hypothetical protein
MKSDFEQWLSAQFADTGPFTIFIVLVRIADDEAVPLKSSYAHLIGDDMAWREMRGLLDRAGTVGRRGVLRRPRPCRRSTARRGGCAQLRRSGRREADPLTLNRSLFFDREAAICASTRWRDDGRSSVIVRRNG